MQTRQTSFSDADEHQPHSLNLFENAGSHNLDYPAMFPEHALSDEQRDSSSKWRWLGCGGCRSGLRGPRDQRSCLFYSIYALMMFSLLVAIILPPVSSALRICFYPVFTVPPSLFHFALYVLCVAMQCDAARSDAMQCDAVRCSAS
jgi:hypothetical protein